MKTPTRGTITLGAAAPSATVADVKARLVAALCLPASQQRLLFEGELLEDGRALLDYSIPTNGTLHLVLSQHGGGALPLHSSRGAGPRAGARPLSTLRGDLSRAWPLPLLPPPPPSLPLPLLSLTGRSGEYERKNGRKPPHQKRVPLTWDKYVRGVQASLQERFGQTLEDGPYNTLNPEEYTRCESLPSTRPPCPTVRPHTHARPAHTPPLPLPSPPPHPTSFLSRASRCVTLLGAANFSFGPAKLKALCNLVKADEKNLLGDLRDFMQKMRGFSVDQQLPREAELTLVSALNLQHCLAQLQQLHGDDATLAFAGGLCLRLLSLLRPGLVAQSQ